MKASGKGQGKKTVEHPLQKPQRPCRAASPRDPHGLSSRRRGTGVLCLLLMIAQVCPAFDAARGFITVRVYGLLGFRGLGFASPDTCLNSLWSLLFRTFTCKDVASTYCKYMEAEAPWHLRKKSWRPYSTHTWQSIEPRAFVIRLLFFSFYNNC